MNLPGRRPFLTDAQVIEIREAVALRKSLSNKALAVRYSATVPQIISASKRAKRLAAGT